MARRNLKSAGAAAGIMVAAGSVVSDFTSCTKVQCHLMRVDPHLKRVNHRGVLANQAQLRPQLRDLIRKSRIFPLIAVAGVALASRFGHDEYGYCCRKSAERDECLSRCFLSACITSASEKTC